MLVIGCQQIELTIVISTQNQTDDHEEHLDQSTSDVEMMGTFKLEFLIAIVRIYSQKQKNHTYSFAPY